MKRYRGRRLAAPVAMILAVSALMLAAPPGIEPAGAATSIDLCAQVGRDAGFKMDTRLVNAVAVAMAESSCNPTAQHTNSNGSVDRGLWQINSVHIPPYTASGLLTAQYNANAAFTVSSGGTNWSPWSTYASGAYRTYLASAKSAVARLAPANVIGNGSFENSTHAWSSSSSVSFAISGGAKAGNSSLAATWHGSGWVGQTQYWALTRGKTYTATVWVRTPSGSRTGLLRFWALGGTSEQKSAAFTAGSSAWTQATVALTVARAGHTALKLEVSRTSTGTVYLDVAKVS